MRKNITCITSFVLCVLILLFSMVGAVASTVFIYEGYSYTDLDDNKVSICGWDNRSSDLVIPSMLLNDYVSEIADMAMMDNTYLTSIDLRSAYYLEKIGIMAFKGCSNLSGTITIPSSLNSIGIGAFQDCTNIEFLRVYASDIEIPSQLCMNCSSLKEVSISDGAYSINSYAFANCLLLNKIRIPSSVTSIHSTAFQNCPNLVIYCYYGSYAHQYALDNGIAYEILDLENIPTEPPTVPPTEPEGYLLGDTDDNDDVEVVDATWLQRYIALMNIGVIEDTIMQGDVDGDGDPSIVDAAFIMRYCVGIETPFGIGELVE